MKPPAGQLLQAVKARDFERAKFLLEQGADPNEEDPETGGKVLHVAVEFERSGQMAKLLIDHNADVNAVNPRFGTTPLMYAARSNLDALRFLLDKNPDLSIKDSINRDALKWATNSGNSSAATLIKKHVKRLAEEAKQKIIIDFHETAARNQATLRQRRRNTILKGPQ